MHVSRREIIARGLSNRCPNCGEPTLFPHDQQLRANKECPHCGLKIDRGNGFFLGSMTLNYLATALFFIAPLVLLAVFDVITLTTAVVIAAVIAIAAPSFLYRRAWSWWLMVYYLVLPEQLPLNAATDADID